MTKVEHALTWLNGRIRAGREFPDACSKSAHMFRVEYEDLRVAYDEQFDAVPEGEDDEVHDRD